MTKWYSQIKHFRDKDITKIENEINNFIDHDKNNVIKLIDYDIKYMNNEYVAYLIYQTSKDI